MFNAIISLISNKKTIDFGKLFKFLKNLLKTKTHFLTKTSYHNWHQGLIPKLRQQFIKLNTTQLTFIINCFTKYSPIYHRNTNL